MSSLIANQVKQIWLLFKLNSLFSELLCHCSHLTDTTTTIRLLFLYFYNFFCEQCTNKLFFPHDYSLFYSQRFCKRQILFVRSSQRWSSNTQLVLTQGWLNYFWLSGRFDSLLLYKCILTIVCPPCLLLLV